LGYFLERENGADSAAAKLAQGGSFCRVIYRPLTKPDQKFPPETFPPETLIMRIYGPNGTTIGSPAGSPRRSGSAGFFLPDVGAAAESRPAAAPRATAGIDALLALQGVEDATERRKRSVQRGRSALDALDALKIALLAGTLDPATVGRLREAATGLKDTSGDPRLDAVLSEIELRVEVELAKAGRL